MIVPCPKIIMPLLHLTRSGARKSYFSLVIALHCYGDAPASESQFVGADRI